MADEFPTFTVEQRVAGATTLSAKLTEAGYKTEVISERGKTAAFDSVKVRLSDKAGKAAGDLSLNAKGFINLAVKYTDGDQKVVTRAIQAIEDLELQESPVSQNYVKVKASPGAGGSFLGALDQA